MRMGSGQRCTGHTCLIRQRASVGACRTLAKVPCRVEPLASEACFGCHVSVVLNQSSGWMKNTVVHSSGMESLARRTEVGHLKSLSVQLTSSAGAVRSLCFVRSQTRCIIQFSLKLPTVCENLLLQSSAQLNRQ